MRRLAGIALALFLAGCSGETPEMPAEPEAPASATAETGADPRAPVVVYASYEDGAYWPQFFQAFTEETGIRVNVRTREQSVNVGDVIANRGTPPADVLIADGVHDLWLASDEGALRPLSVDGLETLVEPRFRDPDGQWVGISVRAATIVVDPDAVDTSGIETYEDLGDEALQGKLCLSSSALPVNRALIGMLIDDLGVRPAELAVRYWVRNLAVPPFSSDDRLLDALEAGTCGIGIVSSQAAYARLDGVDDAGFMILFTDAVYANIEGAAVVRHAHQPEHAHRLVEWLLKESQQQRHAIGTMSIPANRAATVEPSWAREQLDAVSGREVSVAGWRDEEAILLAERARYP